MEKFNIFGNKRIEMVAVPYLRAFVLVLLIFATVSCQVFGLGRDRAAIDTSEALDIPVDYSSAAKLSDQDVAALTYALVSEFDREEVAVKVNEVHWRRIEKISGSRLELGGQNYEIVVYQRPALNVLSFANGSIRLYSGMLDLMSDEELLFVIGRQIGHVSEGLSKRQLEVAYSRLNRKESDPQSLTLKDVGKLKHNYLNAKFSQSAEERADNFAVTFLSQRAKSATAAASALQKLAALSANQSINDIHPQPEQRSKRLEKLAKEKDALPSQDPSANYVEPSPAQLLAGDQIDTSFGSEELEPIEFKPVSVEVKVSNEEGNLERTIEKPAIAPQKLSYKQFPASESDFQQDEISVNSQTVVRSATLKAVGSQQTVDFNQQVNEDIKTEPVDSVSGSEQVVPRGWYVQLASETEEAVAREKVSLLRSSGQAVMLQRAEVEQRVYFRVLVGPYRSRSSAEGAKPELESYGILKGVPFVKEF